jgi:hypothetical protein
MNALIRVILTLLLIWLIYTQIKNKSGLFIDWQSHLFNLEIEHWLSISGVMILLPLNYLLESFKWYKLVNNFEKHDFSSAIKGILTGSTAGIITPGRVGDYIGKMMFIDPQNNFRAIWANFVCGISQNIVVISIGLIGFMVVSGYHNDLSPPMNYLMLASAIVFSIGLLILYYNLSWLTKLKRIIPEKPLFSQVKQSLNVVYNFSRKSLNEVLLLSLLRYFVFMIQYILMLYFWGLEPLWAFPFAISVIYLVQTLIPVPPLMGLLIRGEAALIFLGMFTDNYIIILSATFSLWVINLLIPALVGLVYYYRTNILATLGYGDELS